MRLKQRATWAVAVVIAGLFFLVLSIFITDRRLEPALDATELPPIEIPVGSPLEDDVLLYASDVSGNFEIFVDTNDGRSLALTADAVFDSWRPRLSPDRATVLFYRTPAGVADADWAQASLWMVGAQGGDPVEVLPVNAHGWITQGGAEWSPLGSELVMMGERSTGVQLWITSLDGRDVRNLVNTPGDNTFPSWSPDAKRVLFAACSQAPCPPHQREVFAVASAGGEPIQITADDVRDEQPRFSPDGSQIVMRSQFGSINEDGSGGQWDIRVIPTSRDQPARRLVDDGTVVDAPIWRDEQTVLFERVAANADDWGIYAVRVSDAEMSVVRDTDAAERFPGNYN